MVVEKDLKLRKKINGSRNEVEKSNYRNEIEEKKGWKRWNSFSKTTLLRYREIGKLYGWNNRNAWDINSSSVPLYGQ
ncbi:11019_t:CDS:2, partial [Funneliformis caledonium]